MRMSAPACLKRAGGRPCATASKLLRQAVERFRLSMRAYGRIRKVARTVADLAGHDAIQVGDVALALQFRTADGPYGG